jgi:hypothetical protein
MLYLILPAILLLGIYISYQDFRHGVIRGRYLLLLVILGLIYQTLSGSLLHISFTIIYGFLVSFLFWWIGIWPGGDAKFFIVLLLFFPASLYSSTLVLSYLINVFVPVFVFMIAYVLVRSRLKDIRKALNFSLSPYKIMFIFLMVAGFMWFFIGLIKLAGIEADYFITIVILFAVYELFSMTISSKTEVLFIGLFAIRVILDFQNLFSLVSLIYFLTVIGGFVFFRFFLLHLSYHVFTRQIPVKDLKPGMIMAEGISTEFERISFLNSSLIEYLQQKKRKFIHSLDELASKDTKKIKELRKSGKIKFRSIRIYQTQSFAGFILLGYVLTLVFHRAIFLI